MHKLLKLGLRIPEDVRMVGINDVKYASFLPVPLTTLRQPCQDIGNAAMAAMLERLDHPNAPTRDELLDCELVVRQSCARERDPDRTLDQGNPGEIVADGALDQSNRKLDSCGATRRDRTGDLLITKQSSHRK